MTAPDAGADRPLRGDPRSADALAAGYRQLALRIARQVLGDADEAEDVAQDVIIRFTAALPGFDRVAELDPWVYRVTLNRCRDHLRGRLRRRGHLSLDAAASPEPGLAVVPESDRQLDLARARSALARAIETLPDEQREVLRLRYGEGRGFAEIAKLTDTPQGTIASRVFRALRRLGDELAPFHLEVLK